VPWFIDAWIDILSGGTLTIDPNVTVIPASFHVYPGASLIVKPGATLKFRDGNFLLVRGKLDAAGTSTSPVRFTTNRVTPARGAWTGIEFSAGSDPTSKFTYVEVSYARHGVKIDNCTMGLDRVSLFENSGHGLYTTGTAVVTITSSTIRDNSAYGIEHLGAQATVTGTTLRDNDGGAIYAELGNVLLGLTGNSATNNAGWKNDIEYFGGRGLLSADMTLLRSQNLPWRFTGGITVPVAGRSPLPPVP